MIQLFDFEPSDGPDGAPDAAAMPSDTAATPPGGATPEPEPSAGATEAAASPALTGEQIAALRDNPEFQTWMAEEAAGIADARFAQLQDQARGQQPQPAPAGGEPVYINEFLNPLSDNFGQNLMHVLGFVANGINQNVDARFQPLNEQQEQLAAAEQEELLKTAITDTAAGIGELKGGDAAIERVIASVRNVYMPQAQRLYGETDRAAQVAMDKAIRAEIDYQRTVSGAAATENAEHLATLHNAPNGAVAAGAPGVVTQNAAILTPQEIALKYGGLATATLGR